MNTFDRIAGYEKEKEELMTLVEIFNHRKKYELKGATLPKGIIFYGEAGTGKTLFAEVLAKECSLNQIKINLSESASENNIGKQIRRAFLKGSKAKIPTMIFFDELDKLLPNEEEEYYTDSSKAVLAQLLTLIDGMDTSDNIVFVATCNNYYALPSSITRAGRFDKKIGLGLPDLASRIAILNMYIGGAPTNFGMKSESIAKLTGGFSCAALKTLVNECNLRSDENNFVSEELIRSKILEIKEEDLPTERSKQSYMVDATRNLGSFVVSRLYSNSGYVLKIDGDTVCNSFLDRLLFCSEVYDCYDDDDCYDEDAESTPKEETDTVFSKKDYLAAITALLAGYAAEELIFNRVYDNVERSLYIADRLLLKMSECGMFGLEHFISTYHYHEYDYPETYFENLQQLLTSVELECYEKAKAIVEKNKTLIEKLSPILIKRKSIEKAECEELLKELGGIRA